MRNLGRVAALLAAVGIVAPSAHAGGWVPGEDVRNGDRTTLSTPGVDVGRDGTAVATWRRLSDSALLAAIRRPGQGWEHPQPVAVGNVSASSIAFDAAVDADGTATVAWLSTDGAAHVVRRERGATGWGPTQDLSAGGSSVIDLAVGGQGSGIVAWRTGSSIQAALRPPGATAFAPPTTISGTGTSMGQPVAAMDDAGDAAVTWQRQYDVGGGTLRWVQEAATRPVLGTWSTPNALSSTNSGNAGTLGYDIAISRDGGRVTAMWDYIAGGGSPVVTYVADRVGSAFATGTWGNGSPQSSGVQTMSPLFGLADDGSALAAWTGAINTDLTGARRPALGAFVAVPLSTAVVDYQVAAAPSGAGVVAWQTATGGVTGIAAARAPAGGGFDAPKALASGDAAATPVTSASTPTAGADDQDDLYVGYVARSGADRTFMVSIYDAQAPALAAPAVGGEARAGKAMSFSASAGDRIDAAPAIRWDFGDGATADGASATHAYAAGGTYTVKATATDDAGNASSATKVVTVAPAPATGAPGGPGKGGPPVIVEPLKPPRVGARAGARFKHLRGGRTAFTKLTLSGLKKGDAVKLSCSGGGCASLGRKAKKLTAKKGSLDLLPAVRKLRLAPKAKLTITISRKAYTSVKITYTMVKGKDPRRALA